MVSTGLPLLAEPSARGAGLNQVIGLSIAAMVITLVMLWVGYAHRTHRITWLARIADKLALVRTVQFVEPMQHELEEVYSGFPKFAKRPSFGSVISRFRGTDGKLPSYVSLDYNTGTAE